MTSTIMFINIFIWRLYFMPNNLKRVKNTKSVEIVLKRHKLIF